MAANDLEQVLGSRGTAQDHLAAKGCLGFVILIKEIDDALNCGNTASDQYKLWCPPSLHKSKFCEDK